MAMSDEIREQRKLLKGKGPKAYLQYFWDYYRYATLAVIFFGGILISLIVNFVTAKPQLLAVTFLNTYAGFEADQASEEIASQFAEYADISPSEGTVTVNLTQTMQPGTQGEYASMTTATTLMTHIGAGALDVMGANVDNFAFYLKNGTFMDLREVFTQEELEAFGEDLYYVDLAEIRRRDEVQEEARERGEYFEEETYAEPEEAALAELQENFVRPDPAEMEEPAPVGVFLDDAAYVQELGYYTGTAAAVGIINGSKHPEYAAQFLRFLYTEKPDWQDEQAQ